MKFNKHSTKSSFIPVITLLVLISNFCLPIARTNSVTNTTSSYSTESSEDELRLIEFSHFNRPIYANYSELNIVASLESSEVDLADVHLHYSKDQVNWTTVEMSFKEELTENSSLYEATFGPLLYAGNYFILINATRGISKLLDTLTFIITAEGFTGIIFEDFNFQIAELENGTQVLAVQISALGNNVNASTVEIVFNQPEENNTSKLMQQISGSPFRYNVTIAKIDEWQELVNVTFKANTTTGIQYTNTNYYFTKDKPRYPENFLTSQLPAIIAGIGAIVAMSTIFILAKRRPPKKFDFNEEEVKGMKSRKKRKEKEEKT